MERQLRKKKIITAVAAGLLVAVYLMIFLFSADDAAASSSLSVSVTRKLMNLYYRFFSGSGNAASALSVSMVPDGVEAIVRKMAHFTEYMAVGFLSFGIALMWIQKVKTGAAAVVLQVFLSAGIDEIHQYFVPGRYASFRDVLIDTAGGTAGILILFLVYKIRKRRR